MKTNYNNHLSNMYCSDSFYASEHPFDTNLDYSQSFYDERDLKPNEPIHGLVGRLISEAWQVPRVAAPPLVVLTSRKTQEETGCNTMKDYMKQLQQQKETKEQQEEEKRIMIKEDKVAVDKSKWDTILTNLPNESRLGRIKRLVKESNERHLKSKLKWLARKKKKKVKKKTLPQSHRRNGGGKRRNKGFDERDKEVVRLRRATRKKERKAQKKIEEEKRQEEFKNAPPPSKVVENVTQNYIVVDDDEEEEAEQEQMQFVHDHVIKNFDFDLDLDRYLKKIDDKVVVDHATSSPWIHVGKKKKRKKIVVIKLFTPNMIKKEKIEEGRAKLVDTKSMRTTLVRSKMCRSVETGRPCPHGDKCRYAHSPEELEVAPCFFKDACNRVSKVGDCYKNCGRRKCLFLHPDEDMTSYCYRIGLSGRTRSRETQRCIPCSNIEAKFETKIEAKFETKIEAKFTVAKMVNPWKNRAKKFKSDEGIELYWTTMKGKEKKVPKKVHKKVPKKVHKKVPKKKQRPMCRSVGTGRPCPHGDKCRFRHK